MKNKFLALSVLTILSQAAYADDAYENQTWFGGFGEYYNSDNEKFLPGPQYTDGFGAGLEFGTRFSASWAGRVEWSHTNLDTSDTNESINGDRVGIDVLFYPEQSDYYVFTGLKVERYDDTQGLFNVGLGRHWEVNSNFKVITEVAAYHDFGEAYLDHSIKLGVAYSFGGKAVPAQVVEKVIDTDNDSVEDSRDLCPNTPLNSRVDSNGCVIPEEPNQAPVALAEPDSVKIYSGEYASLDAGQSSDTDGDLLQYFWQQTGGVNVELINHTSSSVHCSRTYYN